MSDDVRKTENWWDGMRCACISDMSGEEWAAIPRPQYEALVMAKDCLERMARENKILVSMVDSKNETCRLITARIRELEAGAAAPLPEEIARLIAEGHQDGDDCASDERADLLHRLAAALQAQAREIGRLHERLEDNHEFHLKDGQMVRIEVAPGSIPDGIECRDETIKLLKDRIRELEAERDAGLPTAMDVRGILKPSPETE